MAHPAIFEYLWGTFPDLYSFDTHLVPVLAHLASQRNFDLIQSLYAHPTTYQLFKSVGMGRVLATLCDFIDEDRLP